MKKFFVVIRGLANQKLVHFISFEKKHILSLSLIYNCLKWQEKIYFISKKNITSTAPKQFI